MLWLEELEEFLAGDLAFAVLARKDVFGKFTFVLVQSDNLLLNSPLCYYMV